MSETYGQCVWDLGHDGWCESFVDDLDGVHGQWTYWKLPQRAEEQSQCTVKS